jgi:superfamily II DNA/RNA helicase
MRGLLIRTSAGQMTRPLAVRLVRSVSKSTAAAQVATKAADAVVAEPAVKRRSKAAASAAAEHKEDAELAAAPSTDASELFATLPAVVQSALQAMGIATLFPVQAATLSTARQGKDMVVRSRTGSGKTIAYSLPTVEKLLASKTRNPPGAPGALVLAPTRELALQVHSAMSRLAPSLRTVSVYGGAPYSRQLAELGRSVDIVVGTPGRVQDMIEKGHLDLSHVQVAILDEVGLPRPSAAAR